MAAKAGQILQIEVLVVYGSDPGGSDVNGDSVVDYARNAGAIRTSVAFTFAIVVAVVSALGCYDH